jgi:hypothetical protein
MTSKSGFTFWSCEIHIIANLIRDSRNGYPCLKAEMVRSFHFLIGNPKPQRTWKWLHRTFGDLFRKVPKIRVKSYGNKLWTTNWVQEIHRFHLSSNPNSERTILE